MEKKYYFCGVKSIRSILAIMALGACCPSVAQDSLDVSVQRRDSIAHNVALNVGYSNFGFFGTVDTLRGAQLNVFTSVARDEMRGVSIAGLASSVMGDAYGVQLSGFVNGVNKSMRGVQLSGISNIAKQMNGVQIAGLGNATVTPFRGVQLAGITNVAMGVKRGVQVSGMANVCSSYMRGVQIGGYNYADTLNGWQVGLVNSCFSHPRGWQVGLVNYSRDTKVHKLGLVNINPLTKVDVMTSMGTSSKLNMAVRFRNRSTYNIVGMGTHYMGFDEDFSGALFYRIGQYFNVSPRWSLSGDLGFYHIETFQKHSADKPERLYSLQARLNVDYQITRTLGAFASVGYGNTRYYDHSRLYRQRMLAEMGMTFRLTKPEKMREAPVSLYDMEETDSVSIFAFDNPRNKQKHPWKAAVEAFGINVLVQSFDRYILNEDFAKISWSSIRHNIKNGFVWDNDQFSTNLFAHPYHGGLYFNAARSNGMNFWESIPYSFCGSLMWETTCEVEPPAINDLIATTVGGVCIGEVTHRISDLVLDDSKRGMARFWRELLGGIVCPIRAFNRIISGDAWKVRHQYYKYHDYDRIPVNVNISAGARYLADNSSFVRGEWNPYINVAIVYGDPFSERTRKPYDYFSADITFGLSGNQPLISGIHLLGRLCGIPVTTGDGMKAEIGLFQHFNYYDSEPVKDGSSDVPFRISEAAAIGPGIIYRFPQLGNITKLEQRIFLDAILLGGSLTDYYNVIDRDYNLGSGYSAKINTIVEFGKFGTLTFNADYYRIFTWKGYEGKDLATTDPLYLNAQGDKGDATLFVLTPHLVLAVTNKLGIDLSASYYWRDTHYKYHDDVFSRTFDFRMGVTVKI